MSNSNLVVKMMSGEDLPDNDNSKSFTVVESFGEVRCVRDTNNNPRIEIPLECGQVAMYHPEGNSYLIKNGKTVATFAKASVKVESLQRLKGISSHTHAGLSDLVKMFADKNSYYSEEGNTWWVNEESIFIPDGPDYVLVIFTELLTDELQSSLGMAGYKEFDEFVNPDAGAAFKVYKCHNDKMYEGVVLPRETYFDVKNMTDMVNLTRLNIWEMPRFINIHQAVRGMSDDASQIVLANYSLIRAPFKCNRRGTLMEFKPAVSLDSDKGVLKSYFGKVVNIRSDEDLKDFIKSAKLGKNNPTINIDIANVAISIDTLTTLAEYGYDDGNGCKSNGVYYYTGLSDHMARDRVISDMIHVISCFNTGIPHSLIINVSNLSKDMRATLRSLNELYGYKPERVNLVSPTEASIEYVIAHQGLEVEVNETQVTDIKAGHNSRIDSSFTLQLLATIPHRHRPRCIRIINITNAEFEETLGLSYKHSAEVGGYVRDDN